MAPTPRRPKYGFHKSTGQAVVYLPRGNGKYRSVYLGPYDSPESRREYERVVNEWLAGPAPVPGSLTVSEAVDAYRKFAEGYYQKDGKPTPQLHRIKQALRPVQTLYGDTEAGKFGPLALKACREWLVGKAYARTHVNSLVGCIRRAFSWLVSEELVPPSVSEGLRSVRGLLAGKTAAPERPKVTPAPLADVEAVQKVVLPVVRDLIEFQLLTACRPGEACSLRPCDLDTSGPVWLYRPPSHKTAHHGYERCIFIGPKSQALLAPYLQRSPSAFCFSPREAMLKRLEAEGRKSATRAGPRYSVSAYTRAVRRGCDSAGVPRWRPHRLRHAAGSRLKAEFGWEIARKILGHRHLSVTAVYVEEELQDAIKAMAQVG